METDGFRGNAFGSGSKLREIFIFVIRHHLIRNGYVDFREDFTCYALASDKLHPDRLTASVIKAGLGCILLNSL